MEQAADPLYLGFSSRTPGQGTIRLRLDSLEHHRRWTTLSLQPRRHLFRLPHDAQDVESENFAEIGFRVPAPEKLRRERRILRDIVESLHRLRDAVEVASDADVIDAGDLADVIHMIRDL